MISGIFGKLTYGYRTNAEVLVAHRGLGCLRIVLYICIVAYIMVSMLVLKRFAVFE